MKEIFSHTYWAQEHTSARLTAPQATESKRELSPLQIGNLGSMHDWALVIYKAARLSTIETCSTCRPSHSLHLSISYSLWTSNKIKMTLGAFSVFGKIVIPQIRVRWATEISSCLYSLSWLFSIQCWRVKLQVWLLFRYTTPPRGSKMLTQIYPRWIPEHAKYLKVEGNTNVCNSMVTCLLQDIDDFDKTADHPHLQKLYHRRNIHDVCPPTCPRIIPRVSRASYLCNPTIRVQ